MVTFNQKILAQIHEPGFDPRNLHLDPTNDNAAQYHEFANTVLKNKEQFQSELPLWYCRGICFADWFICISNNPMYPPRALCDMVWENCTGNCANPS